jgi:hypothetical protein
MNAATNNGITTIMTAAAEATTGGTFTKLNKSFLINVATPVPKSRV